MIGLGLASFGQIIVTYFIGKNNIRMAIKSCRKVIIYSAIVGIIFSLILLPTKDLFAKSFFGTDSFLEENFAKCLLVAVFHIPVYMEINLIFSLLWYVFV
jgi:Na+-driven multidrug efflux pump